MYEDFNFKYPDIKVAYYYDSYRVRVKEKNISFAKLRQEECEMCEEFNLHDGYAKDNFQEECIVYYKFQLHINHAEKLRELYQEQVSMFSNTDTVYVSVDNKSDHASPDRWL